MAPKKEDKTQELQRLKSVAYDLIAQRESVDRQLQMVNQRIAEIQNGSKES